MRRSRLIPLAVLTAAGLAACSADAGDFASHAEKLIDEDDDGDLANQLGVDFDGTVCTDPVDTDKDTSFTCTSNGDDGNTWLFTATITGGSDYQIVDAQLVDTGAATTPASTPSPGSAPGPGSTTAGTTPAATTPADTTSVEAAAAGTVG